MQAGGSCRSAACAVYPVFAFKTVFPNVFERTGIPGRDANTRRDHKLAHDGSVEWRSGTKITT